MLAAESTSTLMDLVVLGFGIKVAFETLISCLMRTMRGLAASEPPGKSLGIQANLRVPVILSTSSRVLGVGAAIQVLFLDFSTGVKLANIERNFLGDVFLL
ncbi:hypothetical protein DFH28DRAFT_930684 [Melampsora americana]|nr:hypothetical protein DFH28DRAFT_930684 [Melampsora americana]